MVVRQLQREDTAGSVQNVDIAPAGRREEGTGMPRGTSISKLFFVFFYYMITFFGCSNKESNRLRNHSSVPKQDYTVV